MLYQDYKQKMDKVVNRLRRLNHFRVPIIATLTTILVLVAAFLFSRGMIYGATLKDTKIEYGSQPSFSASALFSDVRYEYYSEATGQWDSEVPHLIGSYKARAISKGSFGERYGKEQPFQIVPKKIEVSIKGSVVVYGEVPDVKASLAYEDSVSCGEFTFENTTLADTYVTPVKESVVVTDKDGRDVTGYYQVSVRKSPISFDKRELVLTVENKDKIYDGTPLTYQVWQTGGEGCVYGDVVIKVDGTFSSITNAGSIENKGEFMVVRQVGNTVVDVTHQYDITQIYGTLTVDKKEVLVHADGGEYVYNGEEHSELGFRIDDSTPLVDGHIASVKQAPVIVNVGEMENILLISVADSESVDVTNNYCFTFDGATIKVVPKEITVITESGSLVYDGFDHSFDGCSLESGSEILEGHRLIVKSAGVIKDVETAENLLVAGVLDGNGNDVTKNYNISYIYGTIEITKRPIVITSTDLVGTYSGKPQSANTVMSGIGELCKNHSIEATFFNTVTECGEIVENDFTAIILDGNGVDVTENYEPSFVKGTLTLEPMPLYLISSSEEKTYDATPLVCEKFTYAEDSGIIVDGHVVKYLNAPSITLAGEETNKFEIEIYDSDGVNKSFNYNISFVEYGTLRVLQRKVTIQALDGFKEYYDGSPLANPGYTVGGEFIVEGQREEVSLVMENDTHAGSWANTVDGVVIYDSESNDVTSSYDITPLSGTITIGKRPVTIISYGFNKVVYYDGEKHTNHVYEVDTTAGFDIVEGEELVATFLSDSYVEYATESKLNVFNIIGVFNDKDENLTSNYAFTTIYGELVLTPRPITVVSGSKEVLYDGSSHTEHSFVVSTEEGLGLVTGQRATATYNSSITDAGKVDNEFTISRIRDWNMRNVIGNYDITYVYGELVVNKREITLTSQGANKVYNDTPLANETVLIGGDNLARREKIQYSNFASITNAGRINNTFDYVIYNRYGEDVTEKNYIVTTDFSAELVVDKRPITITINSYSKVYDGTSLEPVGFGTSWTDYLIKDQGILPNHTITVDLIGEITKVGAVQILWENLVISRSYGGPADPVTDNYEITVIDGTLTVTQREIALDLKDEEKEYDADPLLPTFTGEDVGGLGLAQGDYIVPVLGGSQTNKGTSVSTLLEYKIYNPQGEDVTFCYDPVSITEGSLTIHPRKIVITILDGYREYYDGGAVVSDGFDVDRLLADKGHVISIKIAGQQIDVGSSLATLVENSVIITDASGEDITANYEYTSVDGVLTVEKKRPVTITSATDKFVYDGTSHANESYEIGGMGLATERLEHLVVQFTNPPMINAGVYENKFEAFVFVTEGGEDVTKNYELEYVYGTITIEKITITVTTGSDSKIFDGTDLTKDEYTFDSHLLPSNETVIITVTGSIKYVGSKPNTFDIKVVGDDGIERPITNYEIVENLGTLTIEVLTVTITSDTSSKTYDGLPLTAGGYVTDWDTTEASRLGVLNLSVVVSGSRTEIGRSNNTVVARIYNENGEDVTTNNCEISYVKGTLTVYAQPIEFISKNNTATFNGNVIQMPYVETVGIINTKEHTVKKYFASDNATNGDFVYAGEYANEFTVDIVDKKGNSVLEFYPDITYTFGKIIVKPYAITITPVSQKEQYNGEKLYPLQEIEMPNKYLDKLNSYNSENVFTYRIDEMKDIFVSTPGELLFYEIPADKFHISMNGVLLPDSCFEVTSESGYISLASVLIEINVYAVKGTYNGKFIGYEEDEWYIRDDQMAKLQDGHYVVIKLTGGRTEAGSVDFDEMLEDMLLDGNIKVYDANNQDVTSSYDFKFVGTPLTVKERFVQITAGSAEKIYDGTPLKSDEYIITGGKLASGHTIKRCYFTGEITEVGVEQNIITGIMIVDAKGNDVTDNYNIELVDGVLEVLPDPQDKNNK